MFIVLEGGEGSGKSTQARILYQRLRQEGYPSILLREPGGTPLGDHIRRLLKAQQGGAAGSSRGKRRSGIGPVAELLLFFAARAQLVDSVLRPALKEGQIVVCDRYIPSTMAYQGYGRGVSLEAIEQLRQLTARDLEPDLIVLLDISPEEGLERVAAQTSLAVDPGRGLVAQRMDEEGYRRFEEEPLSFHRKVRNGYLEMAQAHPEQWLVVDATRSQEEIGAIIWERVALLLQGLAS